MTVLPPAAGGFSRVTSTGCATATVGRSLKHHPIDLLPRNVDQREWLRYWRLPTGWR
jgi:hypothetical protein